MTRPAEHPDSYYAATRNDHNRHPALAGQLQADVAVIGAGFTGLSAAISLAERGYDVAVIEANRVGWGASGRNGGQLIDGFVDIAKIEKRLGKEAAGIAWQLGLACRDLVVERIERYGIDCDLKFGFLDLALKQRDLDNFKSEIEHKQQIGYPHRMELVAREDIRSVVGSERYIGAMVNHGNGHLHPLNLCLGEARAAVKLGVRIFEQSPVIRVDHGGSPQVVTAAGSLRAKKIVLAGNAYLGRTEPKLFGAVIPAGSYIIATEALGDERAASVLPTDMAACDQRVALDYFRLSADKRLLFGGLCNYSGRHPQDIKATLRPNMLRAFPQLADARVEFEWGGYIAISMNRIPQLGRIEGNTYYAQGYSGHGLAPSHMAGKLIADAIGGDYEKFDVFQRIGHLKLPGGKWFANPALALGMLYYRMKELL